MEPDALEFEHVPWTRDGLDRAFAVADASEDDSWEDDSMDMEMGTVDADVQGNCGSFHMEGWLLIQENC